MASNLFEITKVSKDMKRGKVKKNRVINLYRLLEKLCFSCYKEAKGFLDAYSLRNDEYFTYYWNSDYDLIGFDIENNNFDWEIYSWLVAIQFPEYLDPEKYNWEDHSWAVAQFCPEKLDPDKYNWLRYANYVAMFCPEKFDCEKFKEKFDSDKFNWDRDSWIIAKFCPSLLDPDKFNWKNSEWAVEKYCPEKLSLKPMQPFDKNES